MIRQPERWGAAFAVIEVPHPWYPAQGKPTRADLTVTELDVEVPPGRPHRIAWVHERADNPGVSITNAAETVFEHVQSLAGPCYVIEHYDERSFPGTGLRNGRRHLPETYDLVTLDAYGHAHWRHLGADPADAVFELVIEAARPPLRAL